MRLATTWVVAITIGVNEWTRTEIIWSHIFQIKCVCVPLFAFAFIKQLNLLHLPGLMPGQTWNSLFFFASRSFV